MNTVTDFSTSGTYSPSFRPAGRVAGVNAQSRPAVENGHTPEIHVRGADSVDISALARKLGLITTDRPQQPFRAELVERIKAQIEQGTYDTPEKFEAAFEKLTNELDVTG